MLASQAATFFNSGNYGQALETLRKLRQSVQNDDDPKIAQNIVVAEYYLRKCTEPKRLLDALTDIR